MKSPFEAMLKRAMTKQTVVSIHNDPHDYGTAYCGFVECLRAGECRIRAYRRYGEPDGWFAFRLQDVLFVETAGAFEHRIGYFVQKEPHAPLCKELPPLKSGPLISGTLRQAKTFRLLIQVSLQGQQHTIGGLVKEVSTSALEMVEIDPHGGAGSLVTVPLDMVLHVSVGTVDCIRAQHLYENQGEFMAYQRTHST